MSKTVSATLPADTTPPSAPLLSVVDLNPTAVALEWTASTLTLGIADGMVIHL